MLYSLPLVCDSSDYSKVLASSTLKQRFPLWLKLGYFHLWRRVMYMWVIPCKKTIICYAVRDSHHVR